MSDAAPGYRPQLRAGHPDPETRRDVEAALAARRELGAEFDDHIAAGLADRVEALVAYRAADRRGEVDATRVAVEAEKTAATRRFVLGIVSVGAGIPITAISAAMTDLPGLMVAWAGIIGVNVAHALGSRRRER